MITVIVPVYNSELYLENCIESIIKQTYKDLEIILVDDGSVDNSSQICKEYADKDKRIKVLTKKNGGQSFARNLGLEMSTGKFISFIDSDDEISSEVFENAMKAFESDAEIDVVQFPVFMNYGLTTQYLNKRKEQKIEGSKYLFQEWIEKENISWIVCNKIFKKEIFDQLRFKNMYYEDNYMVVQVLEKINVLKIIEQGIYYYHHRENSTTTSPHSMEKDIDTQKVNCRIYNNVKKYNLVNAKVILQSKIINVEKSLTVNYNKKSLLHNLQNEISLFSVFRSNLPMKEKFKLAIVKTQGLKWCTSKSLK